MKSLNAILQFRIMSGSSHAQEKGVAAFVNSNYRLIVNETPMR